MNGHTLSAGQHAFRSGHFSRRPFSPKHAAPVNRARTADAFDSFRRVCPCAESAVGCDSGCYRPLRMLQMAAAWHRVPRRVLAPHLGFFMMAATVISHDARVRMPPAA
jgi:hypothetical protein